MEFIKSTQNTLIKRIVTLKDSKGRRETGLFVAEGVRIVKDGGIPIYLFVDSEHVDFGESYDSLTNVYVVSDEVMLKLSDTKSPQGVVAVYKIPEGKDFDMLGDRAIVLDGVTDPGNVGTIIRTAVACGYTDVYLINCADVYSPKVVRSTMSGIFSARLNVLDHEELKKVLTKRGAKIYSLDMNGVSIFNKEIEPPYALLVGSEAHGISEWAKKNSDGIVSLPMEGDIESLNAGVSASVAMYVTRYNK